MSHATKPHRLRIILENPGDDGLDDTNAVTTEIITTLEDCSVHAYFRIFERVLALEGFNERVIMSGAARTAFNEFRNVEMMRSVAQEYSLVLEEDIKDSAAPATETTA